MLELVKSAQAIMETACKVKPGTKVLVMVDDESFPERYGRILMDAANSLGGEAVMAIFKTRANRVDEPPAAIAAIMKAVDQIVYVSNNLGLGHTRAYQEAQAAGVECKLVSCVPEDYFRKVDITSADLELMKVTTERMARMLNEAGQARVTTPAGTDITMSLEGRQALPQHPLASVIAGLPDTAEAGIAPVEGTAEGVIVANNHIALWNYLLGEPIRLVVKGGRAVEITGGRDAEKLRRIAATDENANVIAELGIGTSHTLPKEIKGDAREICLLGTIHIAIGNNLVYGGTVRSKIHEDMLLTEPTLWLDGKVVIKDGAWIE